ncbi:hypothetical protein Micbo1qcDRAFT_206609 [Microdochium bolleyi]|uniref:Uncharacterized protein n=1 Tax=Microdochium bolleyi TaxID=196109 RepID=A0A136IVS0_9PEZI|nr:hypothetical protein Micbo1qcDRAFT_206609 [Microdochium bolleyi]
MTTNRTPQSTFQESAATPYHYEPVDTYDLSHYAYPSPTTPGHYAYPSPMTPGHYAYPSPTVPCPYDYAENGGNEQYYTPLPTVQSAKSGDGHRWGTWTLDIITLSLAVLLAAAIVGILIWMDNKPYFETWRVPLSINSVLAILTAAMTAANLHAVSSAIGQLKWLEFSTKQRTLRLWEVYDDCSRGPMGAVEALFRLPGSILTMGALVTLLSLAIGTLTQQTVELVPRFVTTPDPATTVMSFAMDYNTFPKQNGLSSWNSPDIASRDPGIRGAAMRGIFGIPTPPSFRCGGACSWPGIHHTIAFTSSCTNVTQETMKTKQCKKPNHPTLVQTRCEMTTPGGIGLSTHFVATDWATVLALNTTANQDYFQPGIEQVASPELLRLAVLRSTSGPDSSFNAPEVNNEDVTECTVSLVLREFRDVHTNGTNFKPEAMTDHALGDGHWMQTQASMIAESSGSDGLSINSVFSFNTTADGRALNRSVSVCQQDILGLLAYFKSPSFASEIISGNAIAPESGGAVFAFIGTLKNGTTTAPGAPPAIESVGGLIRSMTDAMSEYVRTSTPTSFEVSGSRVDQVVFVLVVWQWLALPLLLQVLSVVFFVLVVWQSHREGGGRQPLWRNSAIAMLLHGYEPAGGVLRASLRGDESTSQVRRMLEQQVTLETGQR